jgi:hypothetical protein
LHALSPRAPLFARRARRASAYTLLSCAAFLAACAGPPASDSNQPPPPPPGVTVTAPGTRVTTGGNTLLFTALVQNAPNPALLWSVNQVLGGNTSVGTIVAASATTALYTAPSGAGMITVTAALMTDTAVSGSDAIQAVNPVAESGVFSWRNDPMISGVNPQETALTPTSVCGPSPCGSNPKFGKLSSCPVDRYVYAQPLYVANLAIPQMGTHDVIFAATEHDSVYAFDAEATPCQRLWHVSFINPQSGISTVSSCPLSGPEPPVCSPNNENDVGSDDIEPEVGITGTPVIDPATNTLYVVAATKEPPATTPTYHLRLHALDLTSAVEKFGAPVDIQASVLGLGVGSSNGSIAFVPLIQNQRAGLQLSGPGGHLYIAFASHGDQGAYHGWVLAYTATALSTLPTVFNDTPTLALSEQGGIWMAGAAPSLDAAGNIYVASGNGSFDSSNDWGDSLLKLSPATSGLAVLDSFTPSIQALLDTGHLDFGTGGVLLLPDSAGTVLHPHLAIAVDKDGNVYLADRNNLGGYTLGGPDRVVNKIALGTPLYSTPTYWQNSSANWLYVSGDGNPLQALSFSAFANGGAATFTSQTRESFALPGTTPVISANGMNGGIIWTLDNSAFASSRPAVLHAYDATNLGTELYSSATVGNDAAGGAVKFTVPTVFNGKVYVGTQTEISVYGLAP